MSEKEIWQIIPSPLVMMSNLKTWQKSSLMRENISCQSEKIPVKESCLYDIIDIRIAYLFCVC